MSARETCRARCARGTCRYSEAAADLNSQLRARVTNTSQRLHWTECGYDAIFLEKGRKQLRGDRLPDGVHPNAAAWEELAACLGAALGPLVASG